MFSVCILTETGGLIKLDSLGGVLTSHRDMGLPISPDDGGKLPLCAPNELIPEGQCSDRRDTRNWYTLISKAK